MTLELLVKQINEACQDLLESIQGGRPGGEGELPALGLRRAARLPVLAALQAVLNQPILLLTDRADHALTLFDELTLWAPGAARYYFPEPNPLFYENAPWG